MSYGSWNRPILMADINGDGAGVMFISRLNTEKCGRCKFTALICFVHRGSPQKRSRPRPSLRPTRQLEVTSAFCRAVRQDFEPTDPEWQNHSCIDRISDTSCNICKACRSRGRLSRTRHRQAVPEPHDLLLTWEEGRPHQTEEASHVTQTDIRSSVI